MYATFRTWQLNFLAIALVAGPPAFGTDYYVNRSNGNNANVGTSASAPWLDFNNINNRTFVAGDNIYLACGSSWNQELDLHGVGAADGLIKITSYGSGPRPIISRNSELGDRTVEMSDPSYWLLSNLEICHADMGIEVRYTQTGNRSITLKDLYIHDINIHLDGAPSQAGLKCHYGLGINGTDPIFYSAGILVEFASKTADPSEPTLAGLTISDCEIADTTAPFILGASYVVGTFSHNCFRDVLIKDNRIHGSRGPAALTFTTNGVVLGNDFRTLGSAYVVQGTTAVFNCNDQGVSYINNVFDGVPDTNSADETAIDFEAFDNDCKVLGNWIANTAGPAIELLFIDDGIYDAADKHDYNTNIVISGNTFSNNSNPGSNWGNAVIAAGSGRTYNRDVYKQTGAVVDNLLFGEPQGAVLLGGNGGWEGFRVNNNRGVGTSNVYSAGGGFTGTREIYNGAKDFSGTTKGGPWAYEVFTGAGWEGLNYNERDRRWEKAEAYVSEFNLRPQATEGSYVARVWRAPLSGVICIRGHVVNGDGRSDGRVKAEITKNGAVIWSASELAGKGGSGDELGYDTNLDAIAVRAEDVIRFQIGHNDKGSNVDSVASWAPTIAYTNFVHGSSMSER